MGADGSAEASPPRIVVMGVSASGKSTLGRALAVRLGLDFIDADDLHPPANIAMMAAGTPLQDADRWPWLDAVAARLARGAVVIACSALARRYRDRLRTAGAVTFVHLRAEPALLAARLAERTGHFMPAGLLRSQCDTLEDLGSDEAGFAVDAAMPLPALVTRAAERIG